MNTHRTEALKIADRLRDGRTLLPTSAQEIADEINRGFVPADGRSIHRADYPGLFATIDKLAENASALDRLTTAASRCWVAISDKLHDWHLAYLRWDLSRVRLAIERMPAEREQLHAAEERRHRSRTVAIDHETERRTLEAKQRHEVLVRQIQSMSGL
jgi:hypothetical protein